MNIPSCIVTNSCKETGMNHDCETNTAQPVEQKKTTAGLLNLTSLEIENRLYTVNTLSLTNGHSIAHSS